MPMINGEFRHVSIEEWVDGKTVDGIPLDPDKVAGYRAKTTRANPLSGKPFKLDPPKQLTPTQLVGDALTALLREYGLAAKSTCSCKSWAGKMNEWGIAGCQSHRAEIVAHLGEAYHSATWWDTLKAAGSAAYKSLPLTLGGMVDEAIRRAETPLGN
jgi:hypothetical protein